MNYRLYSLGPVEVDSAQAEFEIQLEERMNIVFNTVVEAKESHSEDVPQKNV